jgi:hypothetical protein
VSTSADARDTDTRPEWRVTVGERDIELAHASNAAALHLCSGVAHVELRDAAGAWALRADELIPTRLEAIAFAHADAVRQALLGTRPASAGRTPEGDWLLWCDGDVVAFRHVSWDWALATYRHGNGWLVSVGEDTIGFLPSSMLDRTADG